MLQLLIQVFPNWLCHIEDLMRLDEQRVLACAEKRQRGECEASRGLAAPTGRCQWRQSRDTGYPQCPWIQYTALTILLWSCFCHSKGHCVIVLPLQEYLQITPPVPLTSARVQMVTVMPLRAKTYPYVLRIAPVREIWVFIVFFCGLWPSILFS